MQEPTSQVHGLPMWGDHLNPPSRNTSICLILFVLFSLVCFKESAGNVSLLRTVLFVMCSLYCKWKNMEANRTLRCVFRSRTGAPGISIQSFQGSLRFLFSIHPQLFSGSLFPLFFWWRYPQLAPILFPTFFLLASPLKWCKPKKGFPFFPG